MNSTRLRPYIFIMGTILNTGYAENKPNRIAIDVGHSKSFPGTTSAHGTPEFEFNAALASVIQQTLTSSTTHAFKIGADGNMIDLPKRTQAAQVAHATFFLSIHHDSAQPQYLQTWIVNHSTQKYSSDFSGFSLFVSRKNPQPDHSLRCASAIGAALKLSGFHPALHHAEPIPGESKEWADQTNGVYFYDNLVVLKTATMPALLLEAGVIVNPQEEEKLRKKTTQRSIAQAIKQGLLKCGILNTPSSGDS